MKRFFLCVVVLAAGCVFGIDNDGWLEKARVNIRAGRLLDSDETPEDGVYCLVAEVIESASDKPENARIGVAVLEAKRKLTAYVYGEKISASRKLERESSSFSLDKENTARSFAKFQKRIEAKVDAFVRGMKVIGQVTVGDDSYIVCVTCERFEDDSTILKAALMEYGNEGVVKSVGEGETRDFAKQKALRGAVEQILGTVVIGYDKMNNKRDFQSKVFSATDGVVEKYRILLEQDIGTGMRVEVVAKVSRKTLLDNYSTYMKFLGNPAFYIESNTPDLKSRFTDFFTRMGIRVTTSPEQAAYVIHCVGDYRAVRNPLTGQKGTQLSLRFKVQEINGTEVLIDMTNEVRKSSSFVGDTERQKELCSGKAFGQMRDPLRERIQAMVGKLVGRVMDAAATDE